MQAIVIRDTGEYERVDLAGFAELTKACGGRVVRGGEHEGATAWYEHVEGEVVESPSILTPEFAHLTMWCNEEARNLNMPANEVATQLVGWWGQEPPTEEEAKEMGYDFVIVVDPQDGLPMWMITGDVVITGPTDRYGNDTALSDKDATDLEMALATIVERRRAELERREEVT